MVANRPCFKEDANPIYHEFDTKLNKLLRKFDF